MKITRNNKAISTPVALILVIIVIVAVVGIAISLGGAPAVTNNEITVYIDTVQQNVNYTAPQTLDWGAIQAPNTYTKNFTVTNTGTQNYTIILLTTEPSGTTQTWSYNNSNLSPNTYAMSNLVYTLGASASTGSTTWRLIATNMTTAQPTPTPTSSASPTPTPKDLQFTIQADNGIKNITVTKNSEAPFTLLPEQLPKTYLATTGINLKLQVYVDEDYYVFNGWEFDDMTLPTKNNPLILSDIQGNFTVTATVIPIQTS